MASPHDSEPLEEARPKRTAPRHIVFGGGGTHGVSYVGAVEALEDAWGATVDEWHMDGVGGTSAGAVAALCVAVGLSRAERRRIVRALSDLTSVVPCPDLHLFYRSYGWDTGLRFRAILQEVLIASGLSAEATLADLRRLLRIDFACMCTDLTTCLSVVLRAETFPKMRVVDAVYASCCVPFLFVPFDAGDGRVLVDGCLTDNFPVHLFPSGPETLAVCIDPTSKQRPENLAQYADAIIRCSTLAQFRSSHDVVAKLVIISNGDPFFQTKMTDAVFDTMCSDGYACALDHTLGGRLFSVTGTCVALVFLLFTCVGATSPLAAARASD